MPPIQRILSILVSHRLFDKLQPILARDGFDLSTMTSGKSSLVLLGNLAFDLVLVEHPLPDMELDELLAAVRSPGSPNVEAPLLALTAERPEDLAERFADPHLACHSIAADPDRLLAAAAACLGVAVRRASRLLVQIEVELGAARILRACQTINVSESGMLLRTERLLPIDTEIELAFTLPHASRPLAPRGRVVRHATADGEGEAGLGVCFTRIADEDRELLAAFIRERSAESGAGDGTAAALAG